MIMIIIIIIIIMTTVPIVCQFHAVHSLTHKGYFSNILTSSPFVRVVKFRGSTTNF